MGLFDKVHEMDNERKINKKVNKFFENEDYLNRLKLRYSHASIDLNKINLIIKSEINESNFEEFNMNQRYMEILKMDVNTLYDMSLKGIDTSKFIVQKDLDDYFGEDYAKKYDIEREDLNNNPSYENHKNITPLPKDYMKKKPEEPVKFGPKRKSSSSTKINQSAERLRKLYEEDSSDAQSHVKENKSVKKEIPFKSKVDIEIFTNVKSNTALASAALFLATGVLLAEAKEEMKWVKTQLEIKDDRIIIKRPYIYHKYKDFRYFKVDQEDDYYLFYIGFSNEELIHFKTKEKYLVDIIMDKIEQTGLQYEHVN
ncbi:hypothetical protein [uncultured Methanobrevibacter sp.]|uniref:hypothetical protein n=1 Tax=uncultured Methanobrevibacter sp. TaxID=253161 RepID=UPI0026018D78|nr:hypothetical protein [uncultured Methanobrevibacter sp.]